MSYSLPVIDYENYTINIMTRIVNILKIKIFIDFVQEKPIKTKKNYIKGTFEFISYVCGKSDIVFERESFRCYTICFHT